MWVQSCLVCCCAVISNSTVTSRVLYKLLTSEGMLKLSNQQAKLVFSTSEKSPLTPVITVGEITQCWEVTHVDVNQQAKWSDNFEMHSPATDLCLLCSFLLNCFKSWSLFLTLPSTTRAPSVIIMLTHSESNLFSLKNETILWMMTLLFVSPLRGIGAVYSYWKWSQITSWCFITETVTAVSAAIF